VACRAWDRFWLQEEEEEESAKHSSPPSHVSRFSLNAHLLHTQLHRCTPLLYLLRP